MAKPTPQRVFRDAVKADRQRYESEQAHDRGVTERANKAKADEAKNN